MAKQHGSSKEVESLRLENEALRTRLAMFSEFLGMVSHELRTPLTTIKGSTATVLSDPSVFDPAETRQFFRIIDEQADLLRDLINNLLDLTRIEAGALSVAPEPTDVVYLVAEARNAFMRGGARNDIEVDLAPGLPHVEADKPRIAQVLNNLLSNAAKYSPESSTIRVRAMEKDGHVEISVTDEGRGVPAAQLEHLVQTILAGRWARRGAKDRGGRTGSRDLQGDRRGARWQHLGRERRGGTRVTVHLHDPSE